MPTIIDLVNQRINHNLITTIVYFATFMLDYVIITITFQRGKKKRALFREAVISFYYTPYKGKVYFIAPIPHMETASIQNMSPST